MKIDTMIRRSTKEVVFLINIYVVLITSASHRGMSGIMHNVHGSVQ